MVGNRVEGYFKRQVILRKFWNSWYFMKVPKLMVFYIGFETHGILWRFWNPWYFTKVIKLMVFNRGGYERHFPRFKETSGNTFPIDGLAGETATLDKWLNRDFNFG